MDKKILLFAGIAGPLLFTLSDFAGAAMSQNYDMAAHTISKLTQTGAPFALSLGIAFSLSALATALFGAGLFLQFKKNRLVLTGSLLLALAGLATGLAMAVFPTAPAESGAYLQRTAHLSLAGLAMLFSTGAVFSVSAGLGKSREPFWFFSAAILSAMITASGFVMAFIWNGNAFLGLAERAIVYSFLLWEAVLSATLIRANRNN